MLDQLGSGGGGTPLTEASGAELPQTHEHKPQDWSIRGRKTRSPGMNHLGQIKKGEPQTPGLDHPGDGAQRPETKGAQPEEAAVVV